MFKKPSWIKDIKVLVWDLDGTLYSEEGVIRKEIHKNVISIVSQHKKISFIEAKKLFYKLYNKFYSSTKTLLYLGVDKDYILAGSWYSQAQLKHLKKDQKLIEMFKKLKHLSHILSTNSEQSVTFKKLKILGFKTEFFDKIFTNKEMGGRIKPDPYAFEIVCRHTKLKPCQHLFIGDNENKEIIPAKKIGMRTCLVWGNSKLADVCLATVYDVVKYF